MHSTRGRGPAAREHLMHHAKPARTRPFVRTLGHVGMYLTAAAIGVLLSLVAPLGVSVALAGGWALGYTTYEAAHFHVSPQANHGVLVPWWDQLFGTEVRPDVIAVPRRVAMNWLIDADGAIRDEYANDYRLAGSRRADPQQQARDIEAAFADQPLPLV